MSGLKRKPLWLRLKQRLYNGRYRLLSFLHLCVACGFRPSHGEYVCHKCYWRIMDKEV